MNRGDTAFLLLSYTLNGSPLVEGDYQEIELQLNPQNNYRNVKKLMTAGDIEWGTLTYTDSHGDEQSFTGYYAHLSQEETFNLTNGNNYAQLRIMMNDEVGSSGICQVDLGAVLSFEVLHDSD